MDRGAWQASLWGSKELDMTEQLTLKIITVLFILVAPETWHLAGAG